MLNLIRLFFMKMITKSKQRNRLLSYKRFIISFTGILLAGSLLMENFAIVIAAPSIEERLELQREMEIASNTIPNWPTGPVVSAESAVLIDADTGAILYSKNIHQRQYPASTTKIMTCLLAIENSSMDESVKISRTAVDDTPSDSSHIAMDAGEEITMEQALNAILIRSANEVSFAVAEHISGTWQKFAELMNQRAQELGCTDTHFINPNGLPDDNHYTSSYDLAQIARAFFSSELLCKISSSTVLNIPATDKQPDNIIEHSGNQLLKGKTYEYPYLVGSKTGYTTAARSCLVSCAEKDGMRLICVVMNDESPLQYEDTISLFDYGFHNFDKVNVSQSETKYNIDDTGFFYSDNNIFGSSKPMLSLNRQDCIILPKTLSFEDISSSISYDTQIPTQAAIITYSYQDTYLGSASVDFATEQEESSSFESLLPSEAKSTEELKSEEPIIINVAKLTLYVAIAAAVIAIAIFGHWFVNNHQFSRPNNRRTWRRSRKKKPKPYKTLNSDLRQRRIQQAQEAKRRRKRK